MTKKQTLRRIQRLLILVPTSLSILFFSCATSSRLSERPFQWIDRRSIETEGVTTYHLIYGQGLVSEANRFIYPAYWRQGVTPKLTLIWMPLPLEIEWLVGENPHFWHTARFSFLGQVYSRNRNFDWRPEISWTGRYRIGPKVALDLYALIRLEVTRESVGNPGNQQSLSVGPLFQPLTWLGVKPSVVFLREYGTLRARYVGAIPSGNQGVESEKSRFFLPLRLESSFQISNQIEFKLDLEFQRLGYPDGFVELPMFFSFNYSW